MFVVCYDRDYYFFTAECMHALSRDIWREAAPTGVKVGVPSARIDHDEQLHDVVVLQDAYQQQFVHQLKQRPETFTEH